MLALHYSLQIIDRTRESISSTLAPVNAHAYGPNSGGSGGGGGGGGGNNVRSFHDLESGEGDVPMPRDKFLAKLPVSVIK